MLSSLHEVHTSKMVIKWKCTHKNCDCIVCHLSKEEQRHLGLQQQITRPWNVMWGNNKDGDQQKTDTMTNEKWGHRLRYKSDSKKVKTLAITPLGLINVFLTLVLFGVIKLK